MMNWKLFKYFNIVDTRIKFACKVPSKGKLLDVGSSDGETLKHINEIRPDLKLYATDIVDYSNLYPKDCNFYRGDIQSQNLPWESESFDAITCMQLLEHLSSMDNLLSECKRLLKKGGRCYFETPHPKTLCLSSPKGKAVGSFTINFYDDPTHINIVPIGRLAYLLKNKEFKLVSSGTSRNWLFAFAYPIFFFLPPSRKKFTSYIHFKGWSSYLIVERI